MGSKVWDLDRLIAGDTAANMAAVLLIDQGFGLAMGTSKLVRHGRTSVVVGEQANSGVSSNSRASNLGYSFDRNRKSLVLNHGKQEFVP